MHAERRGARKLLLKFSQYAAKFVGSGATEHEARTGADGAAVCIGGAAGNDVATAAI